MFAADAEIPGAINHLECTGLDGRVSRVELAGNDKHVLAKGYFMPACSPGGVVFSVNDTITAYSPASVGRANGSG